MPKIFPVATFIPNVRMLICKFTALPTFFGRTKIFGGQNDNSCKTYPLVFVALRRDLEVTGGHRRIDGTTGGDGARYCADDRRRAGQPDGDRRDCGHPACDCGVAVVLEGNILKK